MKKIIAAIALAIVSIVIGVAALASANSSPSYSPEEESKIALVADANGVSVEDMKETLVRAKKSCKLGYDIRTNQPLDITQHKLCLAFANLGLVDMK